MAQAEEKKVESPNNDSQGKIIIALGSGSAIKKKVVEDTFDSKATVLPLRFASGVPEQPVGKKQTMEGALHRANKAKELQPDASIYIGMENGMYREEQQDNDASDIFDHWFDIGCIVIIYKNEKNELVEDIVWSDALPIPVKSTKECLTKDGKAAKNDGNYTWSPLKDPHSELTNGKRPRKMWLLEAMQKWKAKSIFK
eukprot:532231_1